MLKVNVEALPFRNTLLSYFLTYMLGKSKPKPTYTPIKVSDRKRRKYNPKFIKALQQETNYKTWDELCKAYNIPMGSIGYLLKKGKDNPNGQVIINIDRVIIRKWVIWS